MAINRITINSYKKYLGKNESDHNLFEINLPDIINTALIDADLSKINLYNLKEEYHTFDAGESPSKAVIFANGTVNGANEEKIILEAPLLIYGVQNTFTRFLHPLNDGILITSENGINLAEWRESTYELNILFDLFQAYDEDTLQIFRLIMEEFNRLVWFPKTMENSWKFTQSKDRLTGRFIDQMKRNAERQLERDKNDLHGIENNLEEWKRNIKTYSDRASQKRRLIQTEMENVENVSNALITDLDLIIAHPKVKDLHIKDGKFTVHTNPLIIHSDKGKHYLGGSYRIELIPDNADIKFFGSPNPHRIGFWSELDPHPHVDGRSGNACLGNISSTLAELCSQMQIYALVLSTIDFLESANTSDVAGAKVKYWTECNEDGSPMEKKGGDETIEEDSFEDDRLYECDNCEDRFEDTNEVFDSLDDNGDPVNGHYVCNTCLEEKYLWHEDAEIYISKEWDGWD